MCNWHVHRKYLHEGPELHKRIPARKPGVTDALCNWEINSQITKCQGESSTRSLKAPFKVPPKGPLNPPFKAPLKAPLKVPLKAPLKGSLKALFKVRPPSCTPYCALEGAPLVTPPLALPRMDSWVFLRGALRGTLQDSVVLPQ